MLPLTCALCAKSTNYAAEELLGRYFICKQCHWLNLLQVEARASTREARKNESAHAEARPATQAQHANVPQA